MLKVSLNDIYPLSLVWSSNHQHGPVIHTSSSITKANRYSSKRLRLSASHVSQPWGRFTL